MVLSRVSGEFNAIAVSKSTNILKNTISLYPRPVDYRLPLVANLVLCCHSLILYTFSTNILYI